jgi:hypothetical protein
MLTFWLYVSQLDPGHTYNKYLVLALKTRCDISGTRAVLTIGRKPRVVWTPLRTYSLQNYFSNL